MPGAMTSDQDGKAAGKKRKTERLASFTQGKTTYKGGLHSIYVLSSGCKMPMLDRQT
jgi:hypothetical protein